MTTPKRRKVKKEISSKKRYKKPTLHRVDMEITARTVITPVGP